MAEAIYSLRRAGEYLGYAEERRRGAEDRLAEVEREPMRARLPGRLGSDARSRADQIKRNARSRLDEARRAEQDNLRRCEAARSRLADVERAAEELAGLRKAQTRRQEWLSAHPEEVRWAQDLRDRIWDRRGEQGNAMLIAHISGREAENRLPGPSRLPRAKELPAVERPAKRPRTPSHEYSPPPPSRGAEREGPVLGL